MVDISRALSITGWMSEPELTWLAEQAADHQSIVEIGSYLGRSTAALADHTRGTVYAIDDWNGPRTMYFSAKEKEALFVQFLDNKSANTVPIRADHRAIDPGLFIPDPDMVFIDGGHEYEECLFDISYWWPRLQPGGLMCGHDLDWPGVNQAVTEVFADKVFKAIPDGCIWWVQK